MNGSAESLHGLFLVLVGLHITAGAPGLLSFWVPVLTKKGGLNHKLWGKVFTFAMLFTGVVAMAMSCLTLLAPAETHPHLAHHPEFSNPALIRNIFGWMMLYLAVLTINLSWYGWRCIANRANHRAHRGGFSLLLQAVLLLAAANCAWQGWRAELWMMIGISTIGFATVITNLWFILNNTPGPLDWLLEHIKGIVGVGISVYTAFFAFGAVRVAPWLALNPALWALPLLVGLGLILYHREAVSRPLRRASRARAAE